MMREGKLRMDIEDLTQDEGIKMEKDEEEGEGTMEQNFPRMSVIP